MKVGEIMNANPVRIDADASVRQAVELVAGTQTSDVMVVDDQGGLVGVLSEGDLIRAALPKFDELLREGVAPSDAFELFADKGRELADRPLAPLVIRSPLTVTPDDYAFKAATTMVSKQIRRLPVVKDGKLVGTVSRADVCRAMLG